MKKLTDFEMLSILGGWADPEECKGFWTRSQTWRVIPIRQMKLGINGPKNSISIVVE